MNAQANKSTKRPKAARRRKTMSWELRLYVAGTTPKSVAAFANLKEICETHMGGKYRIEIIDLLRNPQLASGDQIVAVPTAGAAFAAPGQKNHWRPVQHPAGAGWARSQAGASDPRRHPGLTNAALPASR